MALSRPVVVGIVLTVLVLVLIALPLPWIGIGDYNVNVQTTLGETCVIACSYSVQSVNPTVASPSTILDIWGWFGIGESIAPPCVDCQYKVMASLSGSLSASASETKFVSNLLNFGYTDTITLSIAYVPAGTYTVTVILYLNGSNVAEGTGSLTVGG